MNKTNKYLLAPIGLLSLTAFSGAILMSCNVNADNDSVVDQVSITVPISCTLSGSGMTSHNASIPNGTYTDDIGTTTLKAFCNDNSGFAIYAVGYTGNEIGATNSTKLVGTSASNNATIDTGTATGPVSGNDTSNWAMKLETISSPTPTYPITLDNGYGSYSIVPSSYVKVAHRDNGTDIGTNAEGSTLTTTYAAYISKTQAADTYTGQVKYTLVHPSSEEPKQPVPCTAGNICYQPNASDVVGTMGNQELVKARDWSSCYDTDYESYCYDSDYDEINISTLPELDYYADPTLYASNFSRTGYGFAGWSDAYDYATNPNAHFYGPQQTIPATNNIIENGLSLYVVWVPSTGSLQSDATTACNSLTQDPNDGTADLSSVTALTDERDNQTYAIAKLADGKCWMIENLRLADKDSNNNDIILSSSNTHNPSLPLNNSWYYKNQQGTLTTSNHLSATSDPASTNPDTAWCTTDSSYCDDQSMLNTNNTTLYTNNTASNYSTSSNVYSYGNYYNWYSATAGHGKYGSSYGSGYIAPGDICPAGWHLPTGNTTGEYYALNTAINNGATDSTASNKLRSYPNSFVYSGCVNGASVNNRNFFGYYGSASGDSSGYAYGLYFYSTSVYPGTNFSNKHNGWMVRCVSGV